MNPFEFPESITRYAEAHTTDEDPVLQELFRTTHLKTVHPQMLSGKVQGQFLSLISQMIRPKRILEIGTFTGYSAYCLSKGLQEGGRLVTIEVNEELEEMVRAFFNKAGIAHKTELMIGDALDLLPGMKEEFDLIFIDANKEHYPDYYKLCMKVLKKGSFIVADNVLWGGKVAEAPILDESTRKLDEFNTIVQQDAQIENVFLTIRDGLMLIRKN
ncbi:MAG: O-methyltransferase [Bacteroidales bacterium]|nr:O-methyltransferase [Bacteroidales bacterium]MDT8431133.1 O-methyltransferase [Bacteroidales bacterium]